MKNCIYFFLIVLFILSMGPFPVIADEDDDLFSDDTDSTSTENNITAGQTRIIFSGTFDARVVNTGEAISWDRKGRGLTRYGGIDTGRNAYRDDLGDEKTTAFKIPQIILAADILVNEHVSGYIQFNYDDHFDSTQKSGHLGLVESYARYNRRFDNAHEIESRFGLLIPPFSLEHPNTGWNTKYTITPSAINSWIGEELRMIGLETNYRYEFSPLYSLDFLLAPFSGNDPSGAILAWRGWALHDYQLKVGSRLRLQTLAREDISPRGGWTEPLLELDGQLGFYTKISFNRAESWKVQLFYHDSNGNPIRSDYATKNYAWKTVFTHFGLEWFATSRMTILFQGLTGFTQMGDPNGDNVDNNYNAWYTLASYTFSKHRITLRYDAFNVEDVDDTLNDPNDSEGIANTVAYLYEVGDGQLVGMEFINVVSKRIGAEGFDPDDDPKDDLLQLMYRITF